MRGRGLRRQLAALAPDELQSLRQQVQDDRSHDTRKLVALCLRELGGAAEVTPSDDPCGRGSEPSPIG